jgi:hypothetical protein
MNNNISFKLHTNMSYKINFISYYFFKKVQLIYQNILTNKKKDFFFYIFLYPLPNEQNNLNLIIQHFDNTNLN